MALLFELLPFVTSLPSVDSVVLSLLKNSFFELDSLRGHFGFFLRVSLKYT